jgi:heme-degrading monooxygenase HmoA
MVYQIVWEFEVEPAQATAFEREYGAKGVWATFFREGDGFLGTALFQSLEDGGRYLTVDRWTSRAAFESFKLKRAGDYADIDTRCAALTRAERLVAAGEDA